MKDVSPKPKIRASARKCKLACGSVWWEPTVMWEGCISPVTYPPFELKSQALEFSKAEAEALRKNISDRKRS